MFSLNKALLNPYFWGGTLGGGRLTLGGLPEIHGPNDSHQAIPMNVFGRIHAHIPRIGSLSECQFLKFPLPQRMGVSKNNGIPTSSQFYKVFH